jgi:hypothetical protein
MKRHDKHIGWTTRTMERRLPFMTIFTIVAVLLVVQAGKGQSANQKNLIEVLEVALLDSQLPSELVNWKNPDYTPWTNAPFIVVKADTAKNLRRLIAPSENNHVWIFESEEIHLYDIHYGLVPTKIKKNGRRLAVDYKTVRYWNNATNPCHIGRLIAKKEDSDWIIVKSNIKETACEIVMH